MGGGFSVLLYMLQNDNNYGGPEGHFMKDSDMYWIFKRWCGFWINMPCPIDSYNTIWLIIVTVQWINAQSMDGHSIRDQCCQCTYVNDMMTISELPSADKIWQLKLFFVICMILNWMTLGFKLLVKKKKEKEVSKLKTSTWDPYFLSFYHQMTDLYKIHAYWSLMKLI